MKLSIAALFLATAASLVAEPAAKSAHFEANLVEKEGAFQRVWLVAATKTQVRYKEAEVAVEPKDARITDFEAIYIHQPKEYTEALDLYQARRYEEAKEAFAKVKEACKPILALENNPGTLAAFYEMECMRRLGDLEGLNAALGNFVKDPLTREIHLRQLEINVMWDAVRTKSWDRVEILAKERADTKLPGDQRAQVAYCHGLALEGLGRPELALSAYSVALTADAAATEEVAREAALRILSIHKADQKVQQAIKVWKTKDENKNSPGYTALTEAGAVAALYEMTLGAGKPLPADLKTFLEYKPEPVDAAPPTS